MNLTEIFEGFEKTLYDIAEGAEARGLMTSVEATFCDRDLQPLGKDCTERAELIAGEIAIFIEGDDRRCEFECAIPIIEGNISSDEVVSELSAMRANVADFLARLDTGKPLSEAFAEICNKETEEIPDDLFGAPEEVPVRSNTSFYITASVLFAVLILVLFLIGRIF